MSFDYFLLCSLISNNIGIIFLHYFSLFDVIFEQFLIFFVKMRSNNRFFTNFVP